MNGTIEEGLADANIEFYIPTLTSERSNTEGTALVEVKTNPIKNIIFIHTGRNIMKVIDEIDGLVCPMIDSMTGCPAIVPDADMQRFMAILSQRSEHVTILRDSYSKFQLHQLVRVKAGPFAGMEGRIVRILRQRQFVVSLGTMAVAVSGLDRSLFEPISE